MVTPNKSLRRVLAFPNAQAAIDGMLEAWLSSIVENNDLLTADMVKLKGRCLEEAPSEFAEGVLKEVESALVDAPRVKKKP